MTTVYSRNLSALILAVLLVSVSTFLFPGVDAEIRFRNTDDGTLVTIPRVMPPSFILFVEGLDYVLRVRVDTQPHILTTQIWYNESRTDLSRLEIARLFEGWNDQIAFDLSSFISYQEKKSNCILDYNDSSIIYSHRVINGVSSYVLDDPNCLELRNSLDSSLGVLG